MAEIEGLPKLPNKKAASSGGLFVFWGASVAPLRASSAIFARSLAICIRCSASCRRVRSISSIAICSVSSAGASPLGIA